MQRVNLDSAIPAVQDFVRGLQLEPDGVELMLGGEVVCKVVGPQRLTEADRTVLLDRVTQQLQRAHERTKGIPARVIEREVREAVSEVRARRQR